LFGDAEAVAETLFVQGMRFVVVGVLRTKRQNNTYGSGNPDGRIAYIPASTMSSAFGQDYVNNFIYRAEDPQRQTFVTRRVYQVLSRICGFDPADTETLMLWDLSETNKIIFYFFLGFNTLLGLCGVFTLMVGGIAVANIMYLLVGQKTGEIGIEMAVGAKRRYILAQFLLQALVLVAAGGMAGFLISWILTTIMGIVPLPEQIGVPVMSPLVCLVTVILLGIVGLLAGYFPARRAASLDPVRALGFGGL
ncbi:MAG: FtsX-like permease family protein, partial [Planctomycetota bacterium]